MSHASADSPPDPTSGLGRHSYWGALAGVFGIALWTRLSVWHEVFVAGQVLTRDPDADYHLLRIARTLDQFPLVPVFDSQLNWPDGGLCPWAPGFDALGALFAWLLGAGPELAEIERVVAFYPVLLGLAMVGATIALVRHLLPAGVERDVAALAAGSLVAVLPRAVTASSLGRVDHHVFEALIYVLLGSWALRAVRAATTRSALPFGFELHGAAVITLAGSGFTGSILYAGLAAAIVIATRMSAPSETATPWIGSGAPALGVSALALWLLYAPSIAQHGQAWDFRLASQLQPALHAALAFGCGLAAVLSRVGAPDAPLRTRLKSRSVWLAVVSVLAGAAIWPWLGDGVWRDAYAWITTQDPWLASIAEFQPLFRSGDWRSLLDFNGWPGLLTPLLVPVALGVLARHDRAIAWAFGFWLIALLPLAWLRSRFATPATLGFAICGGLTLLAFTRVLARRSLPVKPAFVSALLAVVILAADPATRAMLQLRPARRPNAIESVTLTLGALPDPGPARGALVQWSHGHTVLRLGGRPVLSAGFGHWTGAEAFRASETFMQREVSELMQLMDERRLGYVITGMNAPFPAPGDRMGDPRKPFVVQDDRVVWNAPYFLARPLTPLIVGGSGDPELGIPHIPTLMPQYVSVQGAPGMGFPLQRLWLYERVEGARLVGQAPPFAQVVAETPLAIWGQPTTHRAWTRADADGRYELVLPLPTGQRSEALETGPRVTLSSQGHPLAALSISEADVRTGKRIAVDPPAPALTARRGQQPARNP